MIGTLLYVGMDMVVRASIPAALLVLAIFTSAADYSLINNFFSAALVIAGFTAGIQVDFFRKLATGKAGVAADSDSDFARILIVTLCGGAVLWPLFPHVQVMLLAACCSVGQYALGHMSFNSTFGVVCALFFIRIFCCVAALVVAASGIEGINVIFLLLALAWISPLIFLGKVRLSLSRNVFTFEEGERRAIILASIYYWLAVVWQQLDVIVISDLEGGERASPYIMALRLMGLFAFLAPTFTAMNRRALLKMFQMTDSSNVVKAYLHKWIIAASVLSVIGLTLGSLIPLSQIRIWLGSRYDEVLIWSIMSALLGATLIQYIFLPVITAVSMSGKYVVLSVIIALMISLKITAMLAVKDAGFFGYAAISLIGALILYLSCYFYAIFSMKSVPPQKCDGAII